MTWRSFGQVVSLAGFGRSARHHARRSAARARYLDGPPLWATSLETVEDARPSRAAIERIDSPWASPLEISSRSSKLSERAERVRSRGRIPPVQAASSRTVSWWQPTAGPIV
jgi:hypothetical protein